MTEQKDISTLEAEFDSSPGSLVFLPLGEAYLNAGRYVEAMVVCKKGLKSHPDSIDGQVLMSEIYLTQGKLPRARKTIDKLADAEPENGKVLSVMAKLAVSEGNEDEAIKYYKKAISYDATLSEAREFLESKGVEITDASEEEPPPPPAPEDEPASDEEPVESVEDLLGRSKEPDEESGEELPDASMPPLTDELEKADIRDDEEEAEALEGSKEPGGEEFPFDKPGEEKEEPAKEKVKEAAPPAPKKPSVDKKKARLKSAKLSLSDSLLKQTEAEEKRRQEKAKKRMMIVLGVLVTLSAIILISIGLYKSKMDKIAASQKGIIESLAAASYLGLQNAVKQADNLLEVDSSHPLGHAAKLYSTAALYTIYGQKGDNLNIAKQIIENASNIPDIEKEGLYFAGRGMYLMSQNDLKGAQMALEKGILGKNLNNINLVNTMVLLNLKSGDFPMVESYLKKAKAMDSTSIDAFMLEGVYKFQRGRYKDAKNSFDNIMKMYRGLAKRAEGVSLGGGSGAGSALGASKPAEGERRKTVSEVYLKAMPPKEAYYSPDAQLYRALVFVNMGGEQYRAARMQLDEVNAQPKEVISPKTDALKSFTEGLVLIGEKKKKAGQNLINKAMRKDPTNALFIEFVAEKSLQDKDYKSAVKYYEKSIKLNPGRSESFISLAKAYLALKKYDKADKNVRKGGKLMSNKVPSLLLLAKIFIEQKKYDAAEKEVLKAEALKEKNPFALQLKAKIFALKNDPAKAEETYLEAFKQFRSRRYKRDASNCAIDLAKLRFKNRNKPAAMDAALTALKVDKDNPFAHYYIAKLFLGERKRAEAKTHLKEYLKLDPKGKYARRAKKVLRRL